MKHNFKKGDNVLIIHNMYVHGSRVIEVAVINLCNIRDIDDANLFLSEDNTKYKIIDKNIAASKIERNYYRNQNFLTLVSNPFAPVVIKETQDFWTHVMNKKKAVCFLNDILSGNKKYYNGCPVCLYSKHHKDNNGKRFKNNNEYIQYLIKELSK